MNIQENLKRLLGFSFKKADTLQGTTEVPHSEMVSAMKPATGLIYSGQFSQTTTGAPANKSGTTAINPLGLTLGGLSRSGAGIFVFTLEDFTDLTDNNFAIDATKLRCQAMSNVANKFVGSVTMAYSTGTLTVTVYIYATAGHSGSANVGADTNDFTVEIFHN